MFRLQLQNDKKPPAQLLETGGPGFGWILGHNVRRIRKNQMARVSCGYKWKHAINV